VADLIRSRGLNWGDAMSEIGIAERDTGIDRAASAEARDNPHFHREALAAIVRIAKRQTAVHVDDVLIECHVRPKHYNAWAVWMRAIRADH